MSETMSVKTELKPGKELEKACKDVNAEILGEGKYDLYETEDHQGFGIKLKDWFFPIIIGKDGALHYDNFNGSWGDERKLNDLKAHYSLRVAQKTAKKKGFLSRVKKTDEKITLTVNTGAGKKVKMTFDRNNGTSDLEAIGYKGKGCHEALKFFEHALGKCEDVQRKREWYENQIDCFGEIKQTNLCG